MLTILIYLSKCTDPTPPFMAIFRYADVVTHSPPLHHGNAHIIKYADVEVVRDLCDGCRYNMLPAVAEAMMVINHGRRQLLDDGHDRLWKGKAQLVVNEAVPHSFVAAKVSMSLMCSASSSL